MDEPLLLVSSADKFPPVQDSATEILKLFCFNNLTNFIKLLLTLVPLEQFQKYR